MSDIAGDQIVLDAMGVIYVSRDDVAELLIPFVADHKGAPPDLVRTAYHAASLGQISEDTFWREVGLAPDLEDSYLSRFQLVDGVTDFAQTLHKSGWPAVVLTNDVGRWSVKLRQRFALDEIIPNWVVSGDVGHRKPDQKIYTLLEETAPAESYVFVDDRLANVEAALVRGWKTVHFCPKEFDDTGRHPIASSFTDLQKLFDFRTE